VLHRVVLRLDEDVQAQHRLAERRQGDADGVRRVGIETEADRHTDWLSGETVAARS
jgi:hypothetical protein